MAPYEVRGQRQQGCEMPRVTLCSPNPALLQICDVDGPLTRMLAPIGGDDIRRVYGPCHGTGVLR